MFVFNKIIAEVRMYCFIVACSGFHAMWISLLIGYFFELDVFAARATVIISFVVVLIYALKIAPKELRKLEGR